jgi:PAS domain-containing protein
VDLASAMDFRARFAPDVPVLVVRERLDEAAIAQALALGAQDAVTLSNIPRLQLVVGRELRTYRLDRALSSTLASAREYKKQLQHIVEGSTDAIAQVQEGIIVDANPAWLALFGYSNAEEVVGTPLMDAFDPDDHAAIKGALVACMQGKWSGHTLHASALVVSGHTPSLEFQLVRAEFDGDPCVQVVVPARSAIPASTSASWRRRCRPTRRPGSCTAAISSTSCASGSRSRPRAACAASPTWRPTSTRRSTRNSACWPARTS